MRQWCVRLWSPRRSPAVRLRGAGADRRADVPSSRRLGDADRVRLRRRHLDRAEEPAASPRAYSSPPGEESFPRFSPDGIEDRVQRQLRRQPRRLRRPDDAAASRCGSRITRWTTASSAGTPTASACSSRRAARAAVSATASSISSAATGGLPEKLPVPYGEFGAFSPDGTEFAYMPHVAATSGRGSAIAAAGRPTSGCSI